jgi:hypothetical protein
LIDKGACVLVIAEHAVIVEAADHQVAAAGAKPALEILESQSPLGLAVDLQATRTPADRKPNYCVPRYSENHEQTSDKSRASQASFLARVGLRNNQGAAVRFQANSAVNVAVSSW